MLTVDLPPQPTARIPGLGAELRNVFAPSCADTFHQPVTFCMHVCMGVLVSVNAFTDLFYPI